MKAMREARRLGALVAAGAVLTGCGDPGGGGDRLPRRITVSTGTELRTTLEREIGTRSSEEGDRFTVRVAEAVSVAGREAIPVGAAVYGRVLGIEEARRRGGDPTVLRVALESVQVRGGSSILSARVVDVDPEVRSGGDVGRTSAAAVAPGAGRSVGSLLPASGPTTGMGSGMGTGVVLAADGLRAVLPAGSDFRIELTDPLRVRMP